MDSTLLSYTTTDIQHSSSNIVGDESKSKLVYEIVNICKSFLSDPGPTKEAASFCLSSLLTRPDMENNILSDFFEWSTDVLMKWIKKGDAVLSELTVTSFQTIGVLQTACQIFKKGERGKLLVHVSTMLNLCIELTDQKNQVVIR